MKREKMLRSMDLIDEKYIDEAASKQRLRHPRLLAFAACFVLMLTALSLWLFIPFSTNPPDVSRYSDSEYYAIIKLLNLLTYVKPGYKNNFDRILNGFVKGDAMNTGTGAAPDSSSTYREVTDNQADGIIEADRIKRSDEYIYYLHGDTLTVYSIEGEDSKEVGSYSIVFPTGTYYTHATNWEFYLSADCRTVTVVAQCGSQTSDTCVMLISLDVSDPTDIKLKKSVTVSGSYLTSRSADGKLLLVSNFYVGRSPDFSDETTFIPQIDSGDGVKSIPVEDIVTPETLTSARYTVVCTAVVVTLTDPVFFFDLSDLSNITYKDTGIIEGYSTSLIDIGDGHLLGIGFGERMHSIKLEIYEESENGVVSVCSYLFERAEFNFRDYKSFLIDREHKLFGLGIDDHTRFNSDRPEEYERYVLFSFDSNQLRLLVDEPLIGYVNYRRAVYIDDYLYMFSNEDLSPSADEELGTIPDSEENMRVVKVGLTEIES